MGNYKLKIFAGFLLGVATGAAAGILLAPDNGKNTRKKIVGEMDHLKDQLMDEAENKISMLKDKYNQKVEKGSNVIKKNVDHLKDRVTLN